jgi:hypothetical protein
MAPGELALGLPLETEMALRNAMDEQDFGAGGVTPFAHGEADAVGRPNHGLAAKLDGSLLRHARFLAAIL